MLCSRRSTKTVILQSVLHVVCSLRPLQACTCLPNAARHQQHKLVCLPAECQMRPLTAHVCVLAVSLLCAAPRAGQQVCFLLTSILRETMMLLQSSRRGRLWGTPPCMTAAA
jgi:hypothetical protein